MKNFISTLISIVLAGLIYYLALPAINFASAGFWFFLFSFGILWVSVSGIFALADDEITNVKFSTIGSMVVIGLTTVVLIIGGLASSALFRSRSYSKIIKVEESTFEEEIIATDTISDIALMDSETAEAFAKRTLGQLSDLVSVYSVSDDCSTISLNGKPMKVLPLAYDGFFKYSSRKHQGIPGYVLVDPVANTSEFIVSEKPIKYSPSAYFSYDLRRHLRSYDANYIYGDAFFELSDDNEMYWVVPVMTPQICFGGLTVDKIVLVNATNGDIEEYELSDVPSWVDTVYNGDLVSKLYNYYGAYQDGFWNSLAVKEGCSRVTKSKVDEKNQYLQSDYGYKIIGDDVYIYTGITSCNSTSSVIGFILVNARTGKFTYMPIAGADEISAMHAAEGEVSDYGWNASFPSIINVNGSPAYIMVLKDGSNIVKRYAMVNITSYNIVAIDSTQKGVLAKYAALLNGEEYVSDNAVTSDSDVVEEVQVPENLETARIITANVQFIVNKGNTTVYITDVNGNTYRQAFDEFWILHSIGDEVEITYSPVTSGKIATIYSVR